MWSSIFRYHRLKPEKIVYCVDALIRSFAKSFLCGTVPPLNGPFRSVPSPFLFGSVIISAGHFHSWFMLFEWESKRDILRCYCQYRMIHDPPTSFDPKYFPKTRFRTATHTRRAYASTHIAQSVNRTFLLFVMFAYTLCVPWVCVCVSECPCLHIYL